MPIGDQDDNWRRQLVNIARSIKTYLPRRDSLSPSLYPSPELPMILFLLKLYPLESSGLTNFNITPDILFIVVNSKWITSLKIEIRPHTLPFIRRFNLLPIFLIFILIVSTPFTQNRRRNV